MIAPQAAFCQLFAALLLLSAVGCGPTASHPKPAGTPAAGNPPSEDARAQEIRQALAQLPEADRKSAQAQRICPITDAPLGSMGKPVKIRVEGQDVFICCGSCEDELKQNFGKYASKLNR